MTRKLVQGDKLPRMVLDLSDGRSLALPDEMGGRYLVLLFYRGNWCPYCMRHLKRYQAKLEELQNLGAVVIAATADTRESTVAAAAEHGLEFLTAYGVKEETVAELDPWWTDDNHGHYMQPVEFLALRGGTVFGSLYASGPVGRMEVDEVLNSIRSRERRRLEQEQPAGKSTP